MRGLLSSAAAIVFATSLLVASPASAAPTGPDASSASAVAPAASAAKTAQTSSSASTHSGIAKTANLSLFRAGNIISDAVFFNPGTMNAGQIDSFLRSKVRTCSAGYTCLKDWRQNTPTRPADNYCNGYAGAGNESAATIVFKVSQSCGINPQVLIVMLEKEQSLVTMTYPGIGRFNAAMGQGCPDTAGCDPNYAGFFYQVYGAARQMKIYAEGKWFTYYAPGKTWNIRYNPTVACGSSPVYVENTATAALYYYTPYQPNRAALAAGYGTGDGCSAHGNRNFYQYFTDWFGSTQYGSNLVNVSGQAEIYLISGGNKHRVSTIEDLVTFRARFGSVSQVPASYLNALPTGADASRYVHDPRSGTLFVLDPDGTKHRFVNPDQIARFGFSFNSYVNLAPSQIDQFATGADVTDFFRIWDGPDLYLFESGKKRHIATYSTWQAVSRGTSGYVAYMPSAAANALPLGLIALEPNTLVRASSSNDVYLLLGSNALLHIPSFALAAEFGATRYAIVPESSLSANPRLQGSLAPFVQCAGVRKIGVGGRISTVTGSDLGGLSSISLSAQDCSGFSATASTYATPLFIQAPGQPEVYALADGGLKHVRSYTTLQQLNGSRPLSVMTWSKATIADIGVKAPYLEEKGFFSFAGKPEVYQYAAGQLRHVRDYATLVSLNGGKAPAVVSLQAAWFSAYKVGAPILASGTFVQFTNLPEVYQYVGDQLRHVQSYASLVRLGGGKVPTISTLDANLKSGYSIGTPIA